jgi:hypothetical protein
MIAVITAFRKSNKNSLEGPTGANGSSRKENHRILLAFKMALQTNHSTQYTHYRLKHILPLHSYNFNDVLLPMILQRL